MVRLGARLRPADSEVSPGSDANAPGGAAALQALVDASGEALFILDRDLRLVGANAPFARRMGKPLRGLVGGDPFALLPPDIAGARRARFEQARRTRAAVVFEDERDGVRFESHILPILDERGEVARFACHARNVTERRTREEAGRAIFEQLAFGVVRIALDGRCLEPNEQFCTILGVSKEEIVGRPLDAFAGLSGLDVAALTAEARAGTSSERECRCVRRDGTPIWLKLTASLIRPHEGEPTCFVAFVDDITRRKESEARLIDRELRLSTILAHTGEMMSLASVEPDGRFVMSAANARFVETARRYRPELDEAAIVGMTTEEVLRDVFGWPPEELAAATERYRAAASAASPVTHLRTLETPTGSIHTEMTAVPIFAEDGTCRYLLWNARDITARKVVEDELRRSLAEKEVLLQEVHHRVKNNLQVILGLLSLQGRSLEPAPRAALVEAQGRIRTIAMVHDRLNRSGDFGSIEVGSHLAEVASAVSESHQAASPGVELQCTGTGSTLDLDRAIPLGLVVNELLSNAYKHAFPGGRTGRVRLDCQQDEGDIEVTVADDGVGLPPELEWRRATSLGLRLVVALAAQIAGTLEVDARPGEGTTFTLRLPIALASRAAPASP